MRTGDRFVVGGLVMLVVSGCRSAIHLTEYPRTDLEIPAGGNRGYLVGTPPASTGPWKSTRQMVETEIEVPAFSKRKGQAAATSNEMTPPGGDIADTSNWNSSGASAEIIGSYSVKSNDTLWSIAADPTVYGDGTKWRLLFDANRDVLKNPDRLRAGMTLKIPRAEAAGARPGSDASRAGEQASQTEPDGVYKK